MSILDYYKYALLATASYVRMGNKSLDGATFADEASSLDQSNGRLPQSIAQYLFAPNQTYPNQDPWSIRYYYGGDNPATPDISGFAATVFQQGAKGEKVLALRGTEPSADGGVDLWGTDLGQIGILGIALSQTVSMVNLIQRMKGDLGQPVSQIELSVSNIRPDDGSGIGFVEAQAEDGSLVYLTFRRTEAAGLDLIHAGEKITITGHSLSGELAVLAGMIFPDVVNPDIYVFNAAGLNPTTANYSGLLSDAAQELGGAIESYIRGALNTELGSVASTLALRAQKLATPLVRTMLATLYSLPGNYEWQGQFDFAASPTFPGLTIHNLKGEDLDPGDDRDIVASALTGANIYPAPIDIPEEPNSHVMEPLMDSLALQALLYKLNPAIQLSDIESLLRAGSPILNRSEESIAEDLFRLFLPRERLLDEEGKLADSLPTSDGTEGWIGKGSIASRNAFHDAILRIQSGIDGSPVTPGIESLVDKTVSDLVVVASNTDPANVAAIAYRYALKALNPFAVVAATTEASNVLYANHNLNSELTLYDPLIRSGTLSFQWIQDRAAMLVALDDARINDDINGARQLGANTDGVIFNGYDSAGMPITILPRGDPFGIKKLITFDNDQGHEVSGQMKDDHLYGGGGGDVLSGADGVDWLEGGDDNDSLYGGNGGDWLFGGAGIDQLDGGSGANVLDGGTGLDTYIYASSNRGFDYIRDDDGRILVDGIAATGGKRLDGNAYLSADLRTTYRLDGTTLVLNGTIAVLDFQNGDLGITLDDALQVDADLGDAVTGRVLVSSNEKYAVGSTGADIIAEAGVMQYFQTVLAGSGDDVVFVASSTESAVEGGCGADYIVGSDSDDYALGGDFLAGQILSNPGDLHVINNYSWLEETPDSIELAVWDGFESEFDYPHFDSLGYFGFFDAAMLVLGVDGTTDLLTYWNDVIEGRGGNDYLNGEIGSDRLFGQDGDDLIEDGGSTRILGSSGFYLELTKLEAQASDADYLDGGDGNDILRSSSGSDWVFGGEGSDFISGGAIVDGGAGADVLMARTNRGQGYVGALLSGGDGDDIIRAGNGAIINSGTGEDTVIVGLGDIANGGSVSIKDPDGASRFILDAGDSLDPTVPVTFARKASDLVVYYHAGNLAVSVITWTDWFSTSDSGADFMYVGGFYGVGGGHNGNPWDFGPSVNVPFIPYYLTTNMGPHVILTSQQVEEATRVLVEATEMNDQVTGDAQAEMIVGFDGDDTIDGAPGDDVIDGGAGADFLSGGDGADLIFGGDGNDHLDGNSGDDQMNGGKGDDIFVVDSTGDWVTELFSAGTDLVQSSVTYGLPVNVEQLTLTGSAPISGNGNALDNVIIGNSADNILDGEGGADILTGGPGQDTYKYGAGYGDDTISEDGSADEIDSVQFSGGLYSSDVMLAAEAENLVLSLQTGERLVMANWMHPESRVERLVFADLTLNEAQLLMLFPQNSPPAVANAVADQGATEDAAFSFQLQADGFYDADVGDTLTYAATLSNDSALPEWLTFNADTRTFSGTPVNANVGTISIKVTATDATGAAAADVFDIVVVNTNDAPTVANAIADRTATEDAAFNFQVPVNSFADVDMGDTLVYAATLSNASVLPSWLGFNAINATFSGTPLNADVATITVRVTATDDAGAAVFNDFDLVVSNTNDAPTVANAIMNQTATEGEIFSLQISVNSFTDSDADDFLTYSAILSNGANLPAWLTFDPTTRTFTGMPGAQDSGTLQLRVIAADLAGATVFDDFTLDVAPVTGRTIIGSGAGDTLVGTDFDDVIDGRSGADAMTGKRGDDIYYVDNYRDVVTEVAGQGMDSIFSAVTYTLPENVENITLIGAGNIRANGNSMNNILTGNKAANTLIGGAGNDMLDGKGGADSMIGGTGNDSYIVDNASDSVTEYSNQGTDTVQSAISYTLGANIENLILIGTAAINGTGNAAANLLVGNAAVNKLSGKSGNDILQGLGGNDVLTANGGRALFDGGAGADAITGGAGNEMFIGGLGSDTISVGPGSDIVAFNAGDGQDLIDASPGMDNVLSIGGGIRYADLKFTRTGNNLILKTGGMDQITFRDWYARGANRSVASLQVFTEGMPGYDQISGSPLLDDKVEQFDFTALVHAFDAAGQVNGWALTNALLGAHLSGSDSESIGGDLAYQYGKNGTLSGIGLAQAQEVVNASQFGSGTQTLRPIQDLQQGQIRLS